MADTMDTHQHALCTAVDALGTRPHPLRFFRADRPVNPWEPPQAALALAALPVVRSHPGWRTLWINGAAPNSADVAQPVSEGCAPFALRPVAVRGQGPHQALLFCDGSALFGRHLPDPHGGMALLLWPAVAQLRADATKIDKERFARAEAIAGYGVNDVRLRLWEKGQATLLSQHQLWAKADQSRGAHPGFSDLQDAIDRIVAALPAEPVGALGCIGPHGTPIDHAQADWFRRPQWAGMANTNPPWMPHRWIDTDSLEARKTTARGALAWFAIGAQASKVGFHYTDKWAASARPWTSWRVKAYGESHMATYPIDALIASGRLPKKVQDALIGLAIASEGLAYVRDNKERLVQARPPHVGELVVVPPTSAHERMQVAAQWGPTVPWNKGAW
jgi:hypothetical protein